MTDKNKIQNQRVVDHILDVVDLFKTEEDTDHDAFMFMHVSRPRTSDQPKTGEEINVQVYANGCTCSIQHGITEMMERDPHMAATVIAAVNNFQIRNNPVMAMIPDIISMVQDHEKAEKKAKQNSKDASKN